MVVCEHLMKITRPLVYSLCVLPLWAASVWGAEETREFSKTLAINILCDALGKERQMSDALYQNAQAAYESQAQLIEANLKLAGELERFKQQLSQTLPSYADVKTSNETKKNQAPLAEEEDKTWEEFRRNKQDQFMKKAEEIRSLQKSNREKFATLIEKDKSLLERLDELCIRWELFKLKMKHSLEKF